MALEVGSDVWVKNIGHAANSWPYVLGSVLSIDGTRAQVKFKPIQPRPGSTSINAYGNEQGEADVALDQLSLNNPGPPVEDQCMLVQLSEATLLQNTILRSKEDQPYTWLGPGQIVSVNPCGKALVNLYGEEVRSRYADEFAKAAAAPPHPYAMAESALGRLRRHRQVAVLVSGESGSGKTEASRQLVQYLTWRSARETRKSATAFSKEVSRSVQQSSHVLEAFGNASMVANPNSSRFGKLLLLFIEPPNAADEPPHMSGAKIETFLLEKSRLKAFGEGERNFHVLYQLAASARAEEGDAVWPATQLSHYRYLCDDGLRASNAKLLEGGKEGRELTGVARADATADFEKLAERLVDLGASPSGLAALWRLMRAVLLLGQLAFVESADGNASDIVDHHSELPTLQVGWAAV